MSSLLTKCLEFLFMFNHYKGIYVHLYKLYWNLETEHCSVKIMHFGHVLASTHSGTQGDTDTDVGTY